jgi:hypothetical protein
MRDKSRQILDKTKAIIAQYDTTMTVRQLYYQLVASQVIDNNRSQYQRVSTMLVKARLDGEIRWDSIEDRLRMPRHVQLWPNLASFMWTVKQAYHRDRREGQPRYVECWLEKDALSGIFANMLTKYGITLNVGRGYDGWSSIKNAADRFRSAYKEHGEDWERIHIVYFGDFDPSGEDMARSLEERLNKVDAYPTVVKAALTLDDIRRYNLPPDKTKKTDSRRKGFIAKHGVDMAVELDALPPDVLRQRIVEEVEKHVDLDILAETMRREADDKNRLDQIVGEH